MLQCIGEGVNFMAKFDLYKLSPQKQKELLDRFFIAATSLNTFTEVANFFKDLLEPQETAMLARRLKVAEMLLAGEGYNEIRRKLGVGNSTIAGVRRWVNSKRGGYKTAVQRLRKIDKRQERKFAKQEKARSYGWERIKKVYPTVDSTTIDELSGVVEDYTRRRKRKKSLKR